MTSYLQKPKKSWSQHLVPTNPTKECPPFRKGAFQFQKGLRLVGSNPPPNNFRRDAKHDSMTIYKISRGHLTHEGSMGLLYSPTWNSPIKINHSWIHGYGKYIISHGIPTGIGILQLLNRTHKKATLNQDKEVVTQQITCNSWIAYLKDCTWQQGFKKAMIPKIHNVLSNLSEKRHTYWEMNHP